jgi:hypothetical protein
VIAKVRKVRRVLPMLRYLADQDGAVPFGGTMAGVTPRELAQEIAHLHRLAPRVVNQAAHLFLRLLPQESLTRTQWHRVAERVVGGMGYADHPHVRFLHPHQPAGEHLHLFVGAITHGGKVLDAWRQGYRLRAIADRIEMDYGLAAIPPGRPMLSARSLEYRWARDNGMPSERQRLQAILDHTARPGLGLAAFVAALELQGVLVKANIRAHGKVTGMTYQLGRYSFSGMGLGADFTWPGLLRRRHLLYDEPADLPFLFAAAERWRQRFAPGPAPAESSAGALTEPAPDGAGAAAATVIGRQLAALGCPRFDLAVLDAATGRQRHRRPCLTVDEVLAAVPWLERENGAGGEILFRPAAPAGLTLFEGAAARRVEAAIAAGCEPAVIVATPDGGREVWLRGGAPLPPAEQRHVDGALARLFRPSKPADESDFGHLAGFDSPLARQPAAAAAALAGPEQPSRLTLVSATGRPYSRFDAFAAASRAFSARQAIERRSAPDRRLARLARLAQLIAEADREADRRGILATARPPDPGEIEERLESWSAARRDHAAALTALAALAAVAARDAHPAAESRVLATARALDEHRLSLAERLGLRQVPPDITTAVAHELLRWRGALAAAEQRAERLSLDAAARPPDHREAAVAVRTLREELADFARRHALDLELAIAAPARRDASRPRDLDLLRAFDEAARAPSLRLAAELDLARRESELRSAMRTLDRAWETASLRLETLTTTATLATAVTLATAGTFPTTATLGHGSDNPVATIARHRREALLTHLGQLERRRDALHRRLAALAHHRLGRELERHAARLLRDGAPARQRTEGPEAPEPPERPATPGSIERPESPPPTSPAEAPELGAPPEPAGPLERTASTERTQRALALHARLLGERQALAARFQRTSTLSALPAATSRRAAGAALERAHALAARRAADLLRSPSPTSLRAFERASVVLDDRQASALHAATAAELRAARRELRRATAALRSHTTLAAAENAAASPPLGWPRRALARCQAAESALAHQLDAAGLPPAAARSSPGHGRLLPLLDRLRRGDLTPDTLARTRRDLHRRLPLPNLSSAPPLPPAPPAPSAGPPAAPLPPPPPSAANPATPSAPRSPDTLAEALDSHAGARSAVLKAARCVARPTPAADPTAEPSRTPRQTPDAIDLHRLAQAVARLQDASADLDRLAFGLEPRTPTQRPTLPATAGQPAHPALPSPGLAPPGSPGIPPPLRYFLERPDLAARPHRAIATWAAHAVEQGLSAEQIAQAIQRSRPSHFASSRLFGAEYARFLAGAVTHLGRALALHLADDP